PKPLAPVLPEPTPARKSCRLSFFFQPEDGIRDATVTGVQTCALPISDLMYSRRQGAHSRSVTNQACITPGVRANIRPFISGEREIGRASCRERAWGCWRAGAGEWSTL